MPKVSGINHITFAVSDLEESLDFYQNILGLKHCKTFENGAYLEAGSTWICLSVDNNTRSTAHPDYTHIALSIEKGDFLNMVSSLKEYGCTSWKENKSEGNSFYFLDPDGHKLEIHAGSLETRLKHMESHAL